MSRREAVLSAAAIFALALVIRAVAASLVVFPKPEDTAYYVGVARNLLDGRGLVTDAIWSFHTPPLVFPRPAFEVWLPLPAWLAAVPMAVLGSTFAAAQVSSVLVGALVPVLAWRLAADVAAERDLAAGRARTLAIGAGLTAAVYLPLVLHSTLPDSTMLFTALAVGACLVMTRILRRSDRPRPLDPRLLLLGALIGLAAYTRNEAAWIGLAWLVVVLLAGRRPWRERLVLVGVPAVVAVVLFAPWLIRDWREFGTPLPGQALSNALSVSGLDIFAWNDPPTLQRHLSVGLSRLVEMRVQGLAHNLFNVLLLPGAPLAIVGLVGLPWFGARPSLRPLLVLSLITFLVTSLLFPVATTWGTFLHASGPVQVLLIVSALLALDAAIAWVGRKRGWTRPVAWLGPTLTVAGSIAFTVLLMPSFGRDSRGTADLYAALPARLAAAGVALDSVGPIITTNPVWLAEESRVSSLALPNEPPADVLDLAGRFGAGLVIVHGDAHGIWPAVVDEGGPGSECFRELDLSPPPSTGRDPLADTRVFQLVCP